MNERIRELMVQADYPAPELALRAQKLAKLIVRECMSDLYLNGYDDAMIQVQKHFGIEE
jgi:hypothetical protein